MHISLSSRKWHTAVCARGSIVCSNDSEPLSAFNNTNSSLRHVCRGFTTTVLAALLKRMTILPENFSFTTKTQKGGGDTNVIENKKEMPKSFTVCLLSIIIAWVTGSFSTVKETGIKKMIMMIRGDSKDH